LTGYRLLHTFTPAKLTGLSMRDNYDFTGCIIIIIIISDEEIRVTLSHRDVAGALYIN